MDYTNIQQSFLKARDMLNENMKQSLSGGVGFLLSYLVELKEQISFVRDICPILEALPANLDEATNKDVFIFVLNDTLDNLQAGLDEIVKNNGQEKPDHWAARQAPLFLFSTWIAEFPEVKAPAPSEEAAPAAEAVAPQVPTVTVKPGPIAHLLFECQQGSFGIPLSCVREVIELHKVVTLPKSKKHIIGLINFRSEIFPLLDLQRTLGPFQPQDSRFVIVCQVDGKVFGIPVAQASHIEDLESLHGTKGQMAFSRESFLSAVINKGDKTYKIINVDKIIRQDIQLEESKAA